MRNLFKKNFVFFLSYLLFLLFGAGLLIVFSKSDLHLLFNGFHHPFLDKFFFYITHLGDGLFALLLILLLSFVKFRWTILIALCYGVSSLLTQILKHTFFSGSLRPKSFFLNEASLYFVPGVELNSYNSFPSGHATTAFAVFFCLAFIVKNQFIKFLFSFLAILAALSRVYLSQHFFADIYAGSIIGVMVAVIVVLYMKSRLNKPWVEKSFVTLLK